MNLQMDVMEITTNTRDATNYYDIDKHDEDTIRKGRLMWLDSDGVVHRGFSTYLYLYRSYVFILDGNPYYFEFRYYYHRSD